MIVLFLADVKIEPLSTSHCRFNLPRKTLSFNFFFFVSQIFDRWMPNPTVSYQQQQISIARTANDVDARTLISSSFRQGGRTCFALNRLCVE